MTNVILTHLPDSIGEFSALAEEKLTRPEDAAALFLCALRLFTVDREQGVMAMNILKGPVPLTNMDVSWYRDRLRDKPYLPLAYFEGAVPGNNYTPAQPYSLNLYPDPRPGDCEPGFCRLYLKTAGADSPRAIKFRKKGDCWYLWEASSILLGVRLPAAEDPWA